MFFIAYNQLISNPRPSNKQNRGKIHSPKNVVCYRKDKAAGTQFLSSPCENDGYSPGTISGAIVSQYVC